MGKGISAGVQGGTGGYVHRSGCLDALLLGQPWNDGMVAEDLKRLDPRLPTDHRDAQLMGSLKRNRGLGGDGLS